MAVYTYPNTDIFRPDQFDFGIRSNVLVSTSTLNGAMQTVEIPGSRWLASLQYGTSQSADNRSLIEAYWAKVRGQVHRVSLWHLRRPEPRGTVRTASPTITSTITAGSITCSFSNVSNGMTMEPGDLFSVNSQLVMCTNDSTVTVSGGTLGVQFSPPARTSWTAGSAVTLTRPTATFVATSPEVRIGYDGYGVSSFTVDLVEIF